jgi:hypothetical protein
MTRTWAESSAKRKAAGLCPQCGESPEAGFVCCLKCRKGRRARGKKFHDEERCSSCGTDIEEDCPSTWYCRKCYDGIKVKQRAVMRTRRAALVARGLTVSGAVRKRQYVPQRVEAAPSAGGAR